MLDLLVGTGSFVLRRWQGAGCQNEHPGGWKLSSVLERLPIGKHKVLGSVLSCGGWGQTWALCLQCMSLLNFCVPLPCRGGVVPSATGCLSHALHLDWGGRDLQRAHSSGQALGGEQASPLSDCKLIRSRLGGIVTNRPCTVVLHYGSPCHSLPSWLLLPRWRLAPWLSVVACLFSSAG